MPAKPDPFTHKISLIKTKEVLEEGLHRLYEATAQYQCFPGQPPPTRDGEVSTKSILEALNLSVPSRDETANPPLPDISGKRHSSFSPSRRGSRGGPLQQPTPESMSSDQPRQHCQLTNPPDPLHIITSPSSFPASEIQGRLSTHLFESSPNMMSEETCLPQAMSLEKDFSRAQSPMMKEGDMCDQFLAAVGQSQQTSTHHRSFTTTTLPHDTLSDDTFFDFDRYNQEKAITMLGSQQQAHGYTSTTLPAQLSRQVYPSCELASDGHMPMNPSLPSTLLATNHITGSNLEEDTVTQMCALIPGANMGQCPYQNSAASGYPPDHMEQHPIWRTTRATQDLHPPGPH